jgi:tryptophan-rich sensory protein
VLIVAIALNIYLFWRVRPLAGALLLPYLAWVCFATLLTWSVWRANPGVL